MALPSNLFGFVLFLALAVGDEWSEERVDQRMKHELDLNVE